MENDQKDITKVLKWAGIVALLALPVILYFRKKNGKNKQDKADSAADGYFSEFD